MENSSSLQSSSNSQTTMERLRPRGRQMFSGFTKGEVHNLFFHYYPLLPRFTISNYFLLPSVFRKPFISMIMPAVSFDVLVCNGIYNVISSVVHTFYNVTGRYSFLFFYLLGFNPCKQIEKMEKLLEESGEQSLNRDFCQKVTKRFKSVLIFARYQRTFNSSLNMYRAYV